MSLCSYSVLKLVNVGLEVEGGAEKSVLYLVGLRTLTDCEVNNTERIIFLLSLHDVSSSLCSRDISVRWLYKCTIDLTGTRVYIDDPITNIIIKII